MYQVKFYRVLIKGALNDRSKENLLEIDDLARNTIHWRPALESGTLLGVSAPFNTVITVSAKAFLAD